MTTNESTRRREKGNARRVTVTRKTAGWVVSEEFEDRIVRQAVYNDWHRVERALQVFDLQQHQSAHSTNL